MRTLALGLKWTAYSTAIGSVTMTPLLGFVVGDRRPSVVATALQMFVAVLLMLAALAASMAEQHRRRSIRAKEIYRRAVARGAGFNPDDRFAQARTEAHAVDLPWVEADGRVSWPKRVP